MTDSGLGFNLCGYRVIEELDRGPKTIVYRAQPIAAKLGVESRSVVIKLLVAPYPTDRELLNFRHQYTILQGRGSNAKKLDLPGVVSVYSLEASDLGYALVMEDFGGISLARYQQRDRLPLADVLGIAIQLADTLYALGRVQIVHKNLKPANILINPTTRQVKPIDFGIASLLPREYLELQSPSWLEGTLAYLAPEQTGRMNRGIDYRTDFYGLGVTLYELLTGRLPFEVADPLDLIHCHLEREAVRIDVVNPAVPPVVAQIVAKLMAKKAEDRYQSALGLKDDLERCLHQWQTMGAIAAFELAQRDASDRFTIPERLYGRELAVKILLDTFDRVAVGGSKLVLVAGGSGIGKTALINEIHKPITRQHGYFIKGKFDQFNRNMPLSGFVQALRDLINQLTSESKDRLAGWNRKILAAVGANGQVLIDAIPELERIISSQPPAIELPPAAAQQRFSGLFQKLIEVFTTPAHPLTIFLDDLQWADAASLESIELLMAGKGYLLILGAYRDNEVSPAHLLMLTLDRLRQARKVVRKISLAPLTFDDLDRLVADTLRCPRSKTQPLTELIALKTEGNPFFATQFLKALHAAGEIRFNAEGDWECDIARIQALALSDDVVEFMAAQLEQLPPETQQVLKLAACIGNSFDLETLAIVSERSRSSVEAVLWQALEAGLILPSGKMHKFDRDLQDLEDFQDYVAGGSHAPHNSFGRPVSTSAPLSVSQSPSHSLPFTLYPLSSNSSYRFLHDRVQQAAYSLIPAGEKQPTHLQIGRLLLANTPVQQQEEKLFEIVNHFNLAIGSMTVAESILLARLNLRAAVKARAANAYAAAYEYAGIGVQSLGAVGWDSQYSLVLALHETRCEAAFLKGDFAAVPDLAKVALERAKTPLDRVKTYETIIQCHIVQKQHQEAILRSLEILRQLGIKLAPKPNKLTLGKALITTKVALWGNRASLLDLPETIDPQKIASLRILNLPLVPAFFCSQELMVLAITAGIQFTLRHGNTPWSSIFYATYGIILASLGDYNQSYQMGKLAVELDARYQNQVVTAQVNGSVAWFCQPWREHLRNSIPPIEACIKGSMESGNLTTLGLSACAAIIIDFYLGNPLDGIATKISTLESLLAQSPDYSQQLMARFRHTVGNLRSTSTQPTLLYSTNTEEIATIDRLKASGEASALSTIYALKTALAYIFADIPTALIDADAQLPYEFANANCYAVTQLWMFDALTRLAAYPQQDRATQAKLLARVKSTQRQLLKCARSMPANFQHKYDLVAAEKCRVLGDFTQAMALYDRAIAGAKAHQFCQEEAIANELAAKFYLAWDKAKIAAIYMQAAYYGYVLWGSTAKTTALEHGYPQLLAPILAAQQVESNALATLTQITNRAAIETIEVPSATSFDLVTTIQAAQTLASTIELSELIHQLSEILLKNSGAQTCILVLPDDDRDRWLIRSQSVADTNTNSTTIQLSQPLTDGFDYPANLIYWIKNTQQSALFDARQPLEIPDLYLLEHQPPSVFCLPIVKQSRVLGIVYLEHRHTPAIFTQQHQTVISFLCHQAAIALDNANLYRQAQAAAASVRLQQSYLEALLDNIPHMAWLKDAKSQFIAVNRACAAISGCTPAELVGKNDLDLWPVELGQQYRDNDIEVMASGKRQVVEERTWTLEGEPRWLETIKTPIRDSDGQIAGTAGIALDITDRKVMEVALRQSEERYSQLVSNVPGALYQFELKADGTYCLKYISIRCVELFEILPQAAVADLSTILNQIFAADRASFDRSIKKATKLGKSWAWEGRISTPSGQIKWIRGESRHQPMSDGSIVWDGILTDITTRKQTEIALRQSEVRYQKLADNIPGVIYQVRLAPDGSMTYLYMSSGCWELFQLTPGAIVADSTCLLQMLHPEDAAELERVTAESAQNLTPKLWEGRVVLNSGEIKWVKCASRPELQLDGSIVWDGVMLDVTDRKQAELTLLDTNQELQHATRLKDEFLATMSHELRTPLNAILGMSESLQAAVFGTLDPRQMNAIVTIEQSGEHLLSLINDILDVSKISAGQFHLNLDRVSLSQLCKSSLSLVKPQAHAKQIQIETHLVTPDWISVDERRMRQVLINLLNNAVKFTPSGGRVNLTVSIEAGDWLCFAISDTGIGIASADLAKLFQPFIQIDSSLNRKYQGTGLGLVLVKQIVELHGGTVTIESAVGTGSCFRVLLPQTCWQSEPTQIAPASPAEPIGPVPPTILLAAGNEVIIDTFSNYLTAKGYRVILAQTGSAVISLLEGTNDLTGTRPDLVVLDLQLPQCDRLETLAAVCRFNIPTIALTARVSTDERAHCLGLGTTAYLAKPVKLLELYQTIQDCLNLN